MKSKFYATIIIAACCILNGLHAQTNIFPSTGNAGIGTTMPLASAALEMKSTSKGLLIPRMTKTQRDAVLVSTAAKGLLIYQTNSTPGFYYYDGSAWKAVSSKGANTALSNLATTAIDSSLLPGINNSISLGSSSLRWKDMNLYNLKFSDGTTQTTAFVKGWSLTGNAGTDSSKNFIGTTDAHPLIFRVNKLRAGYIGYRTSNTSFGYNALSAITTGNYNTATGTYALAANTSGYNNTAQGSYALANDSSGSFNTAMGSDALHNNTTGNTNTATGNQALYNNTIGSSNTANGFASLYHNTTGYSNVALGIRSLYSNTTASNLVAIGDSALYNNGIGAVNTDDGWYNTAIGSNALFSNTTGYENIANGVYVLYSNTTGIGNTAEGAEALKGNSSGLVNTSIGYRSGYTNETGNGNTYVGAFADAYGDYDYSTAIGYGSAISSSHQIRVGDNTATSIGGYANWTNISDGRVKKNIKQNVPGLAFINKLNPVTYNLDLDIADKIIQRPQIKDKVGKVIQSLQFEIDARKAKEQIVYTGFVAQDVEKAAKSLNYDFSGVDAAKNDKDLYGLRYAEFVVPLVKAVQELSAKNDDLQKQIDDLKAMIVSNQSTVSGQQSTTISSASLQQNIPNPFTHTTTIGYSLPQKFTNAQIIITDKSGKTLKAVTVSGNGKGSLNVDASTLASGAYQYSLVIDGRLIATKQMVLAK